jgi:GTP cyclohydrolase I
MRDLERAAAAVEQFLRALGHDPLHDDALRGTGARVAALYEQLLDGYRVDVPALFSESSPAGDGAQLVVVHRLTTHVVCPHHLTLGVGHAAVAYLPSDRVVGLGVLARVVDAHGHRLVLQEDAGRAIARAILEGTHARGAACMLTLRHGCLEHQGERKRGARVRTLAFTGAFEQPGADRELVLAALLSDPAERAHEAREARRTRRRERARRK